MTLNDDDFMDVINRALKAPVMAMVSKKEDEIKAALDFQLGQWTLGSIKGRCRLERRIGENFETFVLDGVPMVEFYDLEVSPFTIDINYYRSTVTMRYRRLYGQEK